MLTKKRYQSPINTSEVNNIFNKRFKWARYIAEYHPAVSTYRWDKYSAKYELEYKNDGKHFAYTNSPIMTVGAAKPIYTSFNDYTQAGPLIDIFPNSNASSAVGKWMPYPGAATYFTSYNGVFDADSALKHWTWNIKHYKVVAKNGGTYHGEVTMTNAPLWYPENGLNTDGYWYVRKGSSTTPSYYTKGEYVEDVKSVREDEYPENGRHLDGFWYVKIE